MAGLFTRITGAKAGEGRALIWSFAYFFFVLATYYTLRPVRDEMGVRSGVGSLPWLYTATLIASLIIAPIFAFLVARLRRSVFIPLVYGFLVLNILGFWILLTRGLALEVVAKAFFVWITVFSVFAVSVFWSFMADLYDESQAKRLYPVVAAGGALGGVAGSATVTLAVHLIGAANLLLVAAVFLIMAIVCASRLGASVSARANKTDEVKVGGGVLAGFVTLAKSPYLLGIALWVVGLSVSNTFMYSIQNELVGQSNLSPEARTQYFSHIDLWANILIPVIQLLVTRFLLVRFGIGLTLGVLALTSLASYIAIALVPALTVMMVVQIASRTAQYAFSNPARENLWPVVGREEKYKAKNVVDNSVFRVSDVGVSSLFKALHLGAGLSSSTIAFIAAPAMAAWFVLSLILGRTAQKRAAASPTGGH